MSSYEFPKSAIKSEQILLLKAALFPFPESLSYWQQWKKIYQLDRLNGDLEKLLPNIVNRLDNDSQRLMPLVYRNLEKTEDPLIPHLRGIYRYTWMKNQQFLGKMQQVVHVLQLASIDTMALKGIPMSLLYYGDMGVRRMSDLDVMVPTSQADAALRVLEQAPLLLRNSEFEYKHRHLLHAMHLYDSDNVDVDLHWNLMYQHAYVGADDPFWASSQPLQLTDNLLTHTLSPTHQLFHNLVHGFSLWLPGYSVPFRWISDSYVIFTRPDISIDWHMLLDLTERYKVRYPIWQALHLLQTEFRLTLPVDVSERLEHTTLSLTEKVYFSLIQKEPRGAIDRAIRYFPKQWMAYRLFRKGHPGPSIGHWIYNQMRFRIDWPNRDLPF